MEDHCRDVPIPTLHAFGLPEGQCYTHPTNTPLLTKLDWSLRRWLRGLLGREVPTRHIKRNYHNPLSPGYLLLSEAKGKNLAKCWEDHWHDERYRQNLCHSIAGISLSMNKIPCLGLGRGISTPVAPSHCRIGLCISTSLFSRAKESHQACQEIGHILLWSHTYPIFSHFTTT